MNKFFAILALMALVTPAVKADAVIEIDTQVGIGNNYLNIFFY